MLSAEGYPYYRIAFTSKRVKMIFICSSIRLLVSSSGTFTTELLRLTSSGVGNEESLVVLEEELLKLKLGLFVVVLLIVGDESLGDGLSDSHDLSHRTGALNTTLDSEVLKSVSTDNEDGLESFGPHGFGFNQVEGLAINSDESVSLGYHCDGGSVLFLTESSNLCVLNLICHVLNKLTIDAFREKLITIDQTLSF